MKRLFAIAILFVSFAFIFTACGQEEEKYWITASTQAEGCFTSESFENIYNMTYNNNLTTIMNNSYGSDYAELKEVYDPLFKSAISYSYFQYSGLLVNPTTTNSKFKKAVNKFKKEANNFSNALEQFSQQKEDYQEYVTFTGSSQATEDVALAKLVTFKRNYLTLIESAYSLSESLFEVRRIGYYDFSDYEDEDSTILDEEAEVILAINASNLKIVGATIKVVRAYNAKSVANTYSNYYESANNFYGTIIAATKNGSLNVAGDIKSKLSTWKKTYEIFKSESEIFEDIIEKLDLSKLKKCDFDAEEYARQTGDDKDMIYADYFLQFYEKIDVLSKYAKALIG